MGFFEIVGSSLVVVGVYILWYTQAVRRFYDEVVLVKHVGNRVGRLRPSFLYRWATYLLLFALAPLVRYRLRKLDEQMEEEKQTQRRLREKVEREQCLQENIQRAEARKLWLAENPLKLYCKTVSGITAVVRPSEYEAGQVQTHKARRNEQWTEEHVLLPINNTFLFVNKKGATLFGTSFRTGYPLDYLCGWLSDLDDLVKEYGITLETKEDIFVPYVNEALLPFDEHRSTGKEKDYSYELTSGQAPAETQRLR